MTNFISVDDSTPLDFDKITSFYITYQDWRNTKKDTIKFEFEGKSYEVWIYKNEEDAIRVYNFLMKKFVTRYSSESFLKRMKNKAKIEIVKNLTNLIKKRKKQYKVLEYKPILQICHNKIKESSEKIEDQVKIIHEEKQKKKKKFLNLF